MSSQPSMIDTRLEYVSLYPCAPLLSSFITHWQRISMVYLHRTADELLEVCSPLDGVAIFTTPSTAERTLDGTTKVKSKMMVIPAHVGHGTRWRGEGDVIVIGLEPSLVAESIDDAAHFTPASYYCNFRSPIH